MENESIKINNKIAEKHYNIAECHKQEIELFNIFKEGKKVKKSDKKNKNTRS